MLFIQPLSLLQTSLQCLDLAGYWILNLKWYSALFCLLIYASVMTVVCVQAFFVGPGNPLGEPIPVAKVSFVDTGEMDI